jgi:pimeloyl-ACP methyl ester carboxylesterase
MSELPVHQFHGRDGVHLVYRELGAGRPLVLLHGYLVNATLNWVRFGTAAMIAGLGYRVIMADLRGHGDSAKPHDPVAYPPDVLADDGLALIEQLGLTDYDLGGYSLGARTTIRMLARGAEPGRAIVGGMGLEGVVDAAGRVGHFEHILTNLGTFEPDSPEWMAQAFVESTGGDPVALLHVLHSSVDTPIDALEKIQCPTLVVAGADDQDNGSAAALAAALADGRHTVVPGNHLSAVAEASFGPAIAEFLEGTDPRR